jgi:hypothetical protein
MPVENRESLLCELEEYSFIFSGTPGLFEEIKAHIHEAFVGSSSRIHFVAGMGELDVHFTHRHGISFFSILRLVGDWRYIYHDEHDAYISDIESNDSLPSYILHQIWCE